MNAVAVELRDVFRVHSTPEGDAAALQGLSLRVREREVVTVLGPSGSGKSTLLRVVAGLERPSAGILRVFGDDVAKLSTRRLAMYRSSRLGYADQHYARALAPELTARELVALQLGLRGTPREARLRRADELLERVGLAGERDRRPTELSGGEQQRVALCAALAHRPSLFLADEPTGELDARTADRVVHVRDGRISDERVTGAGTDGAIVVGRGGWLRLSEDVLRAAGIDRHATAELRGRELVLEPAGESVTVSQTRQPAPTAAQGACVTGTQAPIVAVRALTKRFGSTAPIDRLDAAFDAGRLTVVTGPSGSGKTTLLLLLAGLELPDEGDVLLDGASLGELDRAGRAEVRRTALAFVGQTAGLTPFLGARENVELALELRGLPATDAAAALDAVGLGEHADRPVSELSAGQRERAALARAIAVRPRVIVADEPTARLDAANALALGTLLAELARTTGATVICATHDPLLIEQADAELSLRSE